MNVQQYPMVCGVETSGRSLANIVETKCDENK